MLDKMAAGPVWDHLCETKNHVMLEPMIYYTYNKLNQFHTGVLGNKERQDDSRLYERLRSF